MKLAFLSFFICGLGMDISEKEVQETWKYNLTYSDGVAVNVLPIPNSNNASTVY